MTEAGGVGLFEFIRLAGGLATVLGLVLVVGWIARRKLPGSGARCLDVEERLALGRGAQLVVVRAENQRLLIGVVDKRIDVLTQLEQITGCESGEAEGDLDPAPAVMTRSGRFARLVSERLRVREAGS